MSLRDAVVRLADEHPHLVEDLLPIIERATGAHCCRKPRPAPDYVVRADLNRLLRSKPHLRPYLRPLTSSE